MTPQTTPGLKPGSDPQAAFRALADPTRRKILWHLANQDMTIGELVEKFAITRAAVKKHLTVLEQGRMISVSVKGRERINHLEPTGLQSVLEWIGYFEQFWDKRLNTLQQLIAAQSATPESTKDDNND